MDKERRRRTTEDECVESPKDLQRKKTQKKKNTKKVSTTYDENADRWMQQRIRKVGSAKKGEKGPSEDKEKDESPKEKRRRSSNNHKTRKCSSDGKEGKDKDKSVDRKAKRRGASAARKMISSKKKGKDSEKTRCKSLELDDDNKLKTGTVITTQNRSIPRISVTVLDMLGKGGFGDVYLVEETKSKNRYALKTEYNREGPNSRIKIEVACYVKIAKYKKDNPSASKGTRLIEFFGSGAIGKVKFFVMSLVGSSLESLDEKFEISYATAVRLSLECFESIAEFHQCGFVHRDIKPANFSVGLTDKRRVFLVDLGMAVRVITEDERMPSTSMYHFIGTPLYAPRSSHMGQVQTRKCDLESWIYTCIDLFCPTKVPWMSEGDKEKVCEMKANMFQEPDKDTTLMSLPSQFVSIINSLEKCAPQQAPDYKFIRDALLDAVITEGVDMEAPFEWEQQSDSKDVKDSKESVPIKDE